MKKLLIASSALVVAAGSAAALDVTLGGNISITSKIDLNDSGFQNATWDAGFTLKASGESMGWTYGGTIALDMTDTKPDGQTAGHDMDLVVSSAKMYMGGDFMGKVVVSESCGDFVDPAKLNGIDEDGMVDNVIGGHCISWSGLEVGGVELKAAVSLDDVDATGDQDTMALGAALDLMGVSMGIEYGVDSENVDFTASTSMAGLDLGLEAVYDEDGNTIAGNDGDLQYVVTVGTSVAGNAVSLNFSPNLNGLGKDVMGKVSNGCFAAEFGIDPTEGMNTADADNANDDFGLYMWSLGYDCAIHDGVQLTAKIGDLSTADTNVTGHDAITGEVKAKITF